MKTDILYAGGQQELLSLFLSEGANLLWQMLWRHLKYFNLLNPTAYVMHHQLNIHQLYALPTLYLCVLYLSENKQRLVPLTE